MPVEIDPEKVSSGRANIKVGLGRLVERVGLGRRQNRLRYAGERASSKLFVGLEVGGRNLLPDDWPVQVAALVLRATGEFRSASGEARLTGVIGVGNDLTEKEVSARVVESGDDEGEVGVEEERDSYAALLALNTYREGDTGVLAVVPVIGGENSGLPVVGISRGGERGLKLRLGIGLILRRGERNVGAIVDSTVLGIARRWQNLDLAVRNLPPGKVMAAIPSFSRNGRGGVAVEFITEGGALRLKYRLRERDTKVLATEGALFLGGQPLEAKGALLSSQSRREGFLVEADTGLITGVSGPIMVATGPREEIMGMLAGGE